MAAPALEFQRPGWTQLVAMAGPAAAALYQHSNQPKKLERLREDSLPVDAVQCDSCDGLIFSHRIAVAGGETAASVLSRRKSALQSQCRTHELKCGPCAVPVPILQQAPDDPQAVVVVERADWRAAAPVNRSRATQTDADNLCELNEQVAALKVRLQEREADSAQLLAQLQDTELTRTEAYAALKRMVDEVDHRDDVQQRLEQQSEERRLRAREAATNLAKANDLHEEHLVIVYNDARRCAIRCKEAEAELERERHEFALALRECRAQSVANIKAARQKELAVRQELVLSARACKQHEAAAAAALESLASTEQVQRRTRSRTRLSSPPPPDRVPGAKYAGSPSKEAPQPAKRVQPKRVQPQRGGGGGSPDGYEPDASPPPAELAVTLWDGLATTNSFQVLKHNGLIIMKQPKGAWDAPDMRDYRAHPCYYRQAFPEGVPTDGPDKPHTPPECVLHCFRSGRDPQNCPAMPNWAWLAWLRTLKDCDLEFVPDGYRTTLPRVWRFFLAYALNAECPCCKVPLSRHRVAAGGPFGAALDHRDGDCSNGHISNFWWVCLSCHAAKTAIETMWRKRGERAPLDAWMGWLVEDPGTKGKVPNEAAVTAAIDEFLRRATTQECDAVDSQPSQVYY